MGDAREGSRNSRLIGEGDAAARARAVDWAATSLGPVDAWPEAWVALLAVCFGARLPMALFCGDDGIMIGNDAYAPLVAVRPGPPARAASAAIDVEMEAARRQVLATGAPTTLRDHPLAVPRAGAGGASAGTETRHFDLTFTSTGAGGVLCAATETTRSVVGERRLRLLHALAEGGTRATTAEEACASVSRALADEGAGKDVPFSRLYLFEPSASRGRLAAASGVAAIPCGKDVDLGLAGARSPLAQAVKRGRPEVLGEGCAIALPLVDRSACDQRDRRVAALLVCGISPEHALDAEYRAFFDVVAGLVEAALGRAGAQGRVDPARPAPPHERDAALAAARREVEEANRVKDELLATLSHELRTPLTSILGWARLMTTRSLDAATLAKGLATIERNARSEAQLIENLLDVSRLTSGKLSIVRQPFDVAAIVDAALEAVRPAAEARAITLDVRVEPGGAGAFVGDASRVQQLVWNLASNAVKFTPRGGNVAVRARHAGDELVLTVEDDGEGIPAEFLPSVFERFRQEDASTTRAHPGLGLGLAIVRHVAELHGGSARAESPGKGLGAKFEVRLPAQASPISAPEASTAPPRARPVPAPAIRSAHALLGLRVLVVDDEPDARDFVAMILSGCGADPRAAATVREALDALDPFHPDVLVSDIGMPDEDGYDLIRHIRSDAGCMRGLPAIAVTACTGSDDRRRAIGAGYQMYLAKPFEPDELIGAISELAGRAHGSARA